MNPPNNFQEAGLLLNSPQLAPMLEQKLIQLAFSSTNSTVAFRAIELLLQRPRQDKTTELDNLTTEQLQQLEGELANVYDRFTEQDRRFSPIQPR